MIAPEMPEPTMMTSAVMSSAMARSLCLGRIGPVAGLAAAFGEGLGEGQRLPHQRLGEGRHLLRRGCRPPVRRSCTRPEYQAATMASASGVKESNCSPTSCASSRRARWRGSRRGWSWRCRDRGRICLSAVSEMARNCSGVTARCANSAAGKPVVPAEAIAAPTAARIRSRRESCAVIGLLLRSRSIKDSHLVGISRNTGTRTM